MATYELGRSALLRLNDIVDRVGATRPNANVELIHKAYVFTAKVHHGQVRMSGETSCTP